MYSENDQTVEKINNHLRAKIKNILIVNILLFAIEIGVLIAIVLIIHSQIPTIN
jgi:hypothetical protein